MVWEAELNQPLELISAKLASPGDAPEDVTAVIGVTGQLKGTVRYEFGKSTGLAVASSMMGEPLQEHNEISMSALGEIANIITGNAAANLYDQGFECEITPPQLCDYGSRVPDDYLGMQIIARFSSGLGRLNIRIGLSETGQSAKNTEPVTNISVESPLDEYTSRVQNVLGYAPPKRRY